MIVGTLLGLVTMILLHAPAAGITIGGLSLIASGLAYANSPKTDPIVVVKFVCWLEATAAELGYSGPQAVAKTKISDLKDAAHRKILWNKKHWKETNDTALRNDIKKTLARLAKLSLTECHTSLFALGLVDKTLDECLREPPG